MHELGIMTQIVRTVDEALKNNRPCELQSFTLQIGEMTDVVPVFMENAWQVVKSSVGFENAEMIIENVPAKARCESCGYTSDVRDFDFTCPECNGSNLKIISGKDIMIKEIQIKTL